MRVGSNGNGQSISQPQSAAEVASCPVIGSPTPTKKTMALRHRYLGSGILSCHWISNAHKEDQGLAAPLPWKWHPVLSLDLQRPARKETMALRHRCLGCRPTFFHPNIHLASPPSGGQNQRVQVVAVTAQLDTSTFQRRLLVGLGSASLAAIGANFAGITSFVLGLSPETGRSLKLDVLYPIAGYSRCTDGNLGFEFVYPSTWVGDQTLLYRAAGRAEQERSLDPPPIGRSKSSDNRRRRRNISEPVVAFGPPGSTGELNVSVIVSPVPLDFRIEAYGGAKVVGEAVIRTIVGSGRAPELKAELIDSMLRQDMARSINYFDLEFRVQSSSFQRHNLAVCCARSGRLYTLNVQAPESQWASMKQDLYNIAASFSLT